MNGNKYDHDEKYDFQGFGEKGERFSKWFENYWYHYKWHTIITLFFAIVIGVCGYQFITREVPDVYVMYAGPEYLSAGDVISFKSAIRDNIDDYNEDGEKGMTLITLTCVSEAKLEALESEAEAESQELYVDLAANAQNIKQFDMEIFAGEAVVCLLDPSLYERVHAEGGFMKMTDLFTEEELAELELYDDCGIYLHSTKFGKYYSVMSSLPDDTVLCIRKISTISVFKGKKKYEKLHDYHVDLFKNIVNFEYPEGYVPETEDVTE